MRLFNTQTQKKETVDPGVIARLFICGITPYDAAHMGHIATYVAFDMLRRTLVDSGSQVVVARNVTDIDDPLFERARRDGVDWRELGEREIAAFRRDLRALNVATPDFEIPVTSVIPEIVSAVNQLIDAGFAYVVHEDATRDTLFDGETGNGEVDGDLASEGATSRVYFEVARDADFGSLSHLDRDEMLKRSIENGGDGDAPGKHDPLDFLLWQASKDDEPSWDSPWGQGRPGWHIECSTIIRKVFNGQTLDVHGGGEDLIFPHHECEASQSRSLLGLPLAKCWMHVGLVGLDGEKMSKSKGNLVFARDLIAKQDPRAVRLAVLMNHYRKSWEWTDDAMKRASIRLENWHRARSAELPTGATFDSSALVDAVRASLHDDLDTPTAIELIDEAAARGNDVSAATKLLGIELD